MDTTRRLALLASVRAARTAPVPGPSPITDKPGPMGLENVRMKPARQTHTPSAETQRARHAQEAPPPTASPAKDQHPFAPVSDMYGRLASKGKKTETDVATPGLLMLPLQNSLRRRDVQRLWWQLHW